MSFNSQGQWLQASWEHFKTWTSAQLPAIDQRLHLLKYRSALSRRRLTKLLNSLPPVFDESAKQASFAIAGNNGKGDHGMPIFTPEWKPQEVEGLGPTIIPGNNRPKAATGVEVQEIKKVFTRELRCMEYVEHRIQKNRLEIERIEAEIYWLECGKTQVLKSQATVDAQFSDPSFSDNLLKKGALRRFNPFADYSKEYGEKYREGEIIMNQSLKESNTIIPPNLPNASSITDMTEKRGS